MSCEKERIECLRTAALKPEVTWKAYERLFYKGWLKNYWACTWRERYARAMSEMFENAPIEIAAGELLVGRPVPMTAEESADWETMQPAVQAVAWPRGQDSHMAIDYERLLNLGIDGVRDMIRKYREGLDITRAEDLDRDEFYKGCDTVLMGVKRFSERYAEEAERMAARAETAEAAAELTELARICRKVPAKPAETFHEALQSVQFVTFCLGIRPTKPTFLQYQLGRPDRYLAPYFEKDLAEGRLTRERAQTLLDCIGIMCSRRAPNGLSLGYMVGGRREDGTVVTGELTRMLIRVVEDIRLVYPAVGLCCCSDTPEEDLRLAISILGKGFSHPALFNDDLIRQGLLYYGLTPKEACHYIHSTCVEITPVGASNVWVASPYTNLLQKLMDLLERDWDDTETLFAAYLESLSEHIRNNAVEQSRDRLDRARMTCEPLLSCFVHDCLEKGVDIEEGGARCNWIMPSFVGLSNTADALEVLDGLVFREKKLTLPKLREMLAANWQGYEKERQMVLHRAQKYGNNCAAPDAWVRRIAEFLAAECEKYRDLPLHGRLIPSLFCWIMHDQFGQKTGASPDGRLAGFPLGDGSGPAQGREMKGPTESILSSTSWNHTPFIGGVAVNMKFSKRMFTEESARKVEAMVKTYMARGGFEIQINVADAETLKKARENPEAYQDLVVRVGGYSDYFTRLTPTMQAEVILRTEHEI